LPFDASIHSSNVAQLDPLLDLVQVGVDDLGPPGRLGGQAAGIASGDQTRHRVMRTTRQLARVTIRTGQIESSKNFHDLLGKLQGFPPGI
jgi:hypothetical protein